MFSRKKSGKLVTRRKAKKKLKCPMMGLGRITTAPLYLTSSLYFDRPFLHRIKSLKGDLCLYFSYAFFHHLKAMCHDILVFRSQTCSITSLALLSIVISSFLYTDRPFQAIHLLNYILVSASHQTDSFLDSCWNE